MTQNTKKQSKLWILLVSILVIAAIVVGLVFILRPNSNAVATMQCNVNPSVQFVLNSQNKVIGVNALNSDGEKIVVNINFIGKSAEESARLFVEISTEADYIKVDTEGTRVDITINATDTAKYDKLKDKITNSVNEFFDENGIIAGAVTKVSDDIKQSAEQLGIKAREYAEMTEDEILNLIQTTTENFENTSITLRTTFMEALDALKIAYENTIDLIEKQIDLTKNQIEQLSGDAKKEAQNFLNELEQNFNDEKAKFEKNVQNLVNELKENSKTILEALKEGWNTLVEKGKTALEAHKTAFEADKTAIQASIEAFRSTLTQE